MLQDCILIALVGALIGLDVTILGQWMISRPLVSGMLIGVLLGDPWAGFKIGVIIELLWIDVIPVGVSIPLDASVVSILASAWYILANRLSMAALVLGICFAVPAGILFKTIDVEMRRRNVFMVHWVDRWVREGKESRIPLLIFIGILFAFLRSFLFYLVMIYPGYKAVFFLISNLPKEIMQGLHLASEVLILLGIIVAYKSIHFRPLETFNVFRQTVSKKNSEKTVS